MGINRYKKLYGKKYFTNRIKDPKRDIMYHQEISRINNITQKRKGCILDVGCGLGEFLSLFDDNWIRYGTEVSKYAINTCKKKGINFDLPDKNNYYDLIVFRGTIQHLNNPLYEIEKRINQLKHGGYMIFLATPNTGGLYYRIFQDLPMLDPEKNFIIPSAKMLKRILRNFGLKVVKVYYPYKESPYAKPFTDYLLFLLRFFNIISRKHAFPKNIMEIYARKP